jgi:hypothetical protein
MAIMIEVVYESKLETMNEVISAFPAPTNSRAEEEKQGGSTSVLVLRCGFVCRGKLWC